MSKIKTVRIDKILSSMGYGSRKDISSMAKSGAILLDGREMTDAGRHIPITSDLRDRMTVDGQPLDPLAGLVILMNKPLGMTCSHKEGGALVYDLLPERWSRRNPVISTVGRLDKQTSGLLLLTDNGTLLHRIISPKAALKKTYRAKLSRPLGGEEADIFASGDLMLKGETKPLASAKLEVVCDTEALLTITEGRYHQVRRMFAAVGNHVEGLHRQSLGGLTLPAGIRPGDWRLLDPHEIDQVFA